MGPFVAGWIGAAGSHSALPVIRYELDNLVLIINFNFVIIGITIVNLLGSTILNLVIWTIVVIMLSVVLYFNDYDNVLRRIIECGVLLFYIAICETLGVVFVDWILKLFEIVF